MRSEDERQNFAIVTHGVKRFVVSLDPAGVVKAEEHRAVPGLVWRILAHVELPDLGRVLRARDGKVNTISAQLFDMWGV